jgi:hypothetical protein
VIHQRNQIDLHKPLGVFSRSPLGSRGLAASTRWQVPMRLAGVCRYYFWILLVGPPACHQHPTISSSAGSLLFRLFHTPSSSLLGLHRPLTGSTGSRNRRRHAAHCCRSLHPAVPPAAHPNLESRPIYSISVILCSYSQTPLNTDVIEPFSLVSHASA